MRATGCCEAGLAGQAVEWENTLYIAPNQALILTVLGIAETNSQTEMNFPAGRCLS